MNSTIGKTQPPKDPYANRTPEELQKYISPNNDIKGSAHVKLERIKNWASQLLHGKWEWLNNKEVAKALDAKVILLTPQSQDINNQLKTIHQVFEKLQDGFDQKKTEPIETLRTDISQLEDRVKSAMIDTEMDAIDTKIKDIESRFTESLSFVELNQLIQELKSTSASSVKKMIKDVKSESDPNDPLKSPNPRNLTEVQSGRLNEIEKKTEALNTKLIMALPKAFRPTSPTAKMETLRTCSAEFKSSIEPLQAHLTSLTTLSKKAQKPALPSATIQKAVEASTKAKAATDELQKSLDGINADIKEGRSKEEDVSSLRSQMETLISQSKNLQAEYESILNTLTSK